MVKKVNTRTQATSTFEKDKKIKKKENQLNNFVMMEAVLRPKVYITDPTSFKSLVQELTGNGRTATTFDQGRIGMGKEVSDTVLEINRDQCVIDMEEKYYGVASSYLNQHEVLHRLELLNGDQARAYKLDGSSPDSMELNNQMYSSRDINGISSILGSNGDFLSTYADLELWLLDC